MYCTTKMRAIGFSSNSSFSIIGSLPEVGVDSSQAISIGVGSMSVVVDAGSLTH